MIVAKKAIPRRTVLRGLGSVLALPLLDSMVPALTALQKTPARPINRPTVRLSVSRKTPSSSPPPSTGTLFPLGVPG